MESVERNPDGKSNLVQTGVVVRGKVRASKSGDCQKQRSFIGNKRAGEGRDSGGSGQRRRRLEGSTNTTWQVSGVRITPTGRFDASDVEQTVKSVVVDLSAGKINIRAGVADY